MAHVLAQRQAQILDTLWQLLGRGGKLLYATCSVFSEENGLQVEQFLANAGAVGLQHAGPADDPPTGGVRTGPRHRLQRADAAPGHPPGVEGLSHVVHTQAHPHDVV